ncbi:MAG: hypothetical protein P8Y70_14545 [Candidatus Lokiarchaeota archaeon]
MIIWIIEIESGVLLLYKPFQELLVDEDLVSGLLAALNQFTIYEFKSGIESLDMGGLRWVYLEDKETNLLFIAADTKDVNAEILRARLNVIKQSFTKTYFDNKNVKDDWDGNTEMFSPFKDVIDEYYSQWKKAEAVTTIAEFFDILGVFQQILNLFMNIVSRIDDPRLNGKLLEVFTNFKNRPEFLNDAELNKIDFSIESGFNIITINASNTDMMKAERELINLIKMIFSTLKNYVGHKRSVTLLIEENVFDYIINNFILIKELNLDKFLLELFLKE